MRRNSDLHNVYLSLGSNIGDREEVLKNAISCIKITIGETVAVSSLYETIPFEFESNNYFLNIACQIQTILSPLELLEKTQDIERKLGRKTKSQNRNYSDRLIDIDVLFYDNLIYEHPLLLIPHPRIHERSFVLDPLSEIASEYVHPLLNKSIDQLKLDLKDID